MCMIDGDYEWGPGVSWRKKPTARKEHLCGECRLPIEPGETYERVEGVWEGDWQTFKTCATCVEVRNRFYCGSYIFGEVWSGISDVIEDITPGCLDGLSSRATAAIIELYENVVEVRG